MSIEPLLIWINRTVFAPKGKAFVRKEVQILKCFARKLSPAEKTTFEVQQSKCRGVFRTHYKMHIEMVFKGISKRDRFKNMSVEHTVAIATSSEKNPCHCAIVSYSGLIKSLVFTSTSKTWNDDMNVVIVSDFSTTGFQPGSATDIHSDLTNCSVRSPKSTIQRNSFTRLLGSGCPEDLEEVLCMLDGIRADAWEFSGVESRLVPWFPRKWLVLLVEDKDSKVALGVECAGTPGYVLLDLVNSVEVTRVRRFKNALQVFLSRISDTV